MRRYTITVNDTTKVIDVEATGANQFRVQVDGRWVDVELDDHRDLGHGAITPVIQPRPSTGPAPSPEATPVPTTSTAASAPHQGSATRDKLTAPMPGVVLSIDTSVGAVVKRGDPVLVLEAMKMKNELRAPTDGVVSEIYVTAGQQVKYGEFLVRFGGN